eukprot:1263998-Karenia_brevis.AAC.1
MVMMMVMMTMVPLAEVFALLVYLRHAIPTCGIYMYVTDCAYVADGFSKGREAMTNGWAAHPNIWAEVY